MENKDNLISRKYLYDKIAELEEDVRKTIVHQPKGSPEYLRCQSRLNELNEFKSEVRDAPTVTDTNVGSKWIPCSERLPEENGDYLVIGTEAINNDRNLQRVKYWDGRRWNPESAPSVCWMAWMPLPQPYKGE